MKDTSYYLRKNFANSEIVDIHSSTTAVIHLITILMFYQKTRINSGKRTTNMFSIFILETTPHIVVKEDA